MIINIICFAFMGIGFAVNVALLIHLSQIKDRI